MSGKSDPFWCCVDGMAEGSFKCSFCGNVFAATVSITRIKHHLAKLRGGGSRPCEKVPPLVQQAAVDNILNGKHGSMSTWVDSMTGGEFFLTGENVAPGMPMPDAPETGLGTEPADQPFEMDMNNISPSLMQSVAEGPNAASTPARGLAGEPRAPVVLMTDEPETRQRTEQAHQSLVDDILRMCRNIMSQEYKYSVVERGSYSESPVHKRRRTRRYVLPTTKLVGEAFERNMKDVWSWLLNDEVSSIGIYGMGGVGKTAFATHIHNQLRHVCQERQDIFHHVCWITVSQDFSIEALQDCIANYFDLDLGDQKDAVVRAGMLLTELRVKKNYVLILDDLWDHFPPEKVGIPLRTDGCKLVFTTRSSDICTKMDCQKTLKVEPLSEDEAWNLFVQKLGHGHRLFHETKQIAKSVVKECAGLPLGIMTMAGSMKGVLIVKLLTWTQSNLKQKWKKVAAELSKTEKCIVMCFFVDS